ncbi:hypothetical protein [Gemmobacter sp. LW-1]|uniref:hypothetical protein n=1 Tax=Gemmobacter sp. LW-1 TaxID=1529005 RepID=UPI0006C74829|nr:hypothetical protein [Gemmobacter sp. LW-1]
MEILDQFFAESTDGRRVRIIKWHTPIQEFPLAGAIARVQGAPLYKTADGQNLNASDDEMTFTTTSGEIFRRL